MSFQNGPGDEALPQSESSYFDHQPAGAGGARGLRSLLAGAAGIAVLGGGALGFLWVSSTPGANAASAVVPGAVATASAPEIPSTTGTAFTASGRDVFAGAVTPNSMITTGSGSASGGGSGSTGTTSSSTSVSSSTTVNRPTSSSSKAPTAPPTSFATTRPAVTPAPVTSTPADSATTSPGWVKPDVRFLSGTDAQGTFEIGGEQRTFAKGDLVYPLNVRYGGIVVDTTATTPAVTATPTATSTDTTVPSVTGIFLSGDDATVGWLVTSNADEPTSLPAAALGKISGRVRAAGSVAGTKDQYSVRVGDQQAIATKLNSSVDGTGLVFNGVSDKRVPTATVFFTDATGVVFFGRFGGGEYDGVWF